VLAALKVIDASAEPVHHRLDLLVAQLLTPRLDGEVRLADGDDGLGPSSRS